METVWEELFTNIHSIWKAKWGPSAANCLSQHKLFNAKVLAARRSQPQLWCRSPADEHHPSKPSSHLRLLRHSAQATPAPSLTSLDRGTPLSSKITLTSRLVTIYLSFLFTFPTLCLCRTHSICNLSSRWKKGSKEHEIKKEALKFKATCSQLTASSRSIRNES